MDFRRFFDTRFSEHPVDWLPLMMLFASESYSSGETMSQWIDLQGATWRRHESVNSTQAHADIYEWPFGILISCKGTDQWAQLFDYALKHRHRNLGWNTSYVHEVGYEYFDGGRTALQEFIRTRLHKPVTVVGHSMGGSLAKITGSFIASLGGNVKEVFTFGAPRFESDSFNEQHTFKCFCFENQRDPVCYIPPRTLPTLKGPRGSLMIAWFPRKYGDMWNVQHPLATDSTLQYPERTANKFEVESWQHGRVQSFWRGNEPEFFFGLASLAGSVVSIHPNEQRFMFGSRWTSSLSLVHQSPFYIWLTSALSTIKYGKRPIGVTPGDTIFRRLHDAVYMPREGSNGADLIPPPLAARRGDTDRRRRLLTIAKKLGSAQYDEYLRRDLTRVRR